MLHISSRMFYLLITSLIFAHTHSEIQQRKLYNVIGQDVLEPNAVVKVSIILNLFRDDDVSDFLNIREYN